MKLKSYTAKTDQGPYLQVNEDDVDVDLRNKLYQIFDGFGGSGVGDKAVQEIKSTVKKFYTRIGGDPDSTLPFYYSHKYLLEGNALINSMHYAHSLIKKENRTKEMNQRAGASGVCISQAENVLTLASTGNLLGLIYRKGHLETLIAPDSLMKLARDDYASHFYTCPTSGFGLFDELHLNVQELRVFQDDLVVLLSDGVYSRIDRDEMKYILDKRGPMAIDKVNELFELANSRGNMDNQSALFLQF